MFAYIEGKISELTPTYVVVDCGGVGYLIHISLYTYAAIKDQTQAKILTHHLVREDAQLLYGFSSEHERKLFLHLVTVSGVGANTARMMQSSMSPQELTEAILSGNVNKIQSVKGIGAKTAQRVIVDLRDRLAKEDWGTNLSSAETTPTNATKDEALSALVMLGFNRIAAEKALQNILKINPNLSAELLIKEALRML
ncbi:MAG: Holliday junction branch migration protein RuvA [Bacteroidales bacterium]|jgi:Holliday junction DNA helicase RuvA|nr:Holliday junction branch migration protein RuvA [Bacteroidales bacterium]